MITMAGQPYSTLRRRGSRTAPLWLLALLLLPGCVATKADVRKLQLDMAAMRARQDSLERANTRQARLLQDSLRASTEIMRTIRGQIANDIKDVKELLLTVQQLLGQNDQRLAQLREQFERQQQQATAPPPAPMSGSSDQANIDRLFQAGMDRLESSPATARIAFQQIISDYPRDRERAADAQFYIAETYYKERNFTQAYKEYETVAESYPETKRAPNALLRAGVIAEENGDRTKARQYYTKVTTNFKNSDEAREASQNLRRIAR
jgi:tol-pal system protein YbgF